jgi:hypothetical protein
LCYLIDSEEFVRSTGGECWDSTQLIVLRLFAAIYKVLFVYCPLYGPFRLAARRRALGDTFTVPPFQMIFKWARLDYWSALVDDFRTLSPFRISI